MDALNKVSISMEMKRPPAVVFTKYTTFFFIKSKLHSLNAVFSCLSVLMIQMIINSLLLSDLSGIFSASIISMTFSRAALEEDLFIG